MEIADAGSRLGDALPFFTLRLGTALPTLVVDRIEDGRGGTTTVLYLTRDQALP